MARRIRTIKPEFFSDMLLGTVSIEARFLAVGLISMSDDEGWFNAHPVFIKSEVFPFQNFADVSASVRGMLGELVRIEFVRLFRMRQGYEVGLVDGFRRHQKIDKPS